MEAYRNPASGIAGYEIHDNYLLIEFKGGKVYRYDEGCVGQDHFSQMKIFAVSQDDLNTYINKNRHIHACGKPI